MRVVEWLIGSCPDLRIKRLTWNSATCHISSLSNFLKSIGCSLEYLSVSFHSEASMPIANSDLVCYQPLLNSVGLRCLTFSHLFLINDELGRSLFWLPHFLRELQSPVIEEIAFEIVWAHFDQLACFDWSRIEDVLSHPRFRNLKRIRLRSSSRGVEKERRAAIFEHFIRTLWPRLAGRGVLMFE